MDQNNKTDKPAENRPVYQYQDQMEDEINLVDLIYPLYKRRRFLVLFCLVITMGIGFISLLSPKIYESIAIIMPETSDDGSSGLVGGELSAAFLEQYGISGIGGSSATSSEVFEAVLKSKSLARDVLDRYNYFFIKGIKNKDKRRISGEFADKVRVSTSNDDPSISVSVQSHDPVFASDIANSYVQALDKYNLTNTFTSARELKEYVDKRLEAADKELDAAQQKLREFQEKHRAISISDQAQATLDILAEMESKRVELEVEKAAKEKFYKGPHIEIEQLEAQMEALQKNIDRLTYSDEPNVPIEHEDGDVEFYIPLNRIPALNFDESRLLLKVKAKTGVVKMLTTQLEQARLDEARDIPTINTLEQAAPPEKSVKPRVILNIVLSFVASLFLGIFIIFFMEFVQRLDRDPESAPKWREIKKGLDPLKSFINRLKS